MTVDSILDDTISEEAHHSFVDDILTAKRTRAGFLTGAAAAAAAFGIAPAAASAKGLEKALNSRTGGMMETPQTILNIAATAETLAVTALYHVHQAVNQNKLSVSGVAVPVNTLVSIVRAALREEQDHLAFILGAGGKALYHSFTLPNSILTNAVETLKFFSVAESIFIGAYMAATREFANAGQGKLAQYTYQIGGVEAEHRTLMRAGLGELPPNNKSFETNLYGEVSGAAKRLASLGLFKPQYPYPGAQAVNRILAGSVTHNVNAGVIQRKP